MTKHCEHCRHWRGDAATYRADCVVNGNAVAFNDGCTAWDAREAATGGTFVTTGPMPFVIGDGNNGNDLITVAPSNSVPRCVLGTLSVSFSLPDMSQAFSRFSQAALDAARAAERVHGAIRIGYTPLPLAYELNGYAGVGALGLLSPSEIDTLYGEAYASSPPTPPRLRVIADGSAVPIATDDPLRPRDDGVLIKADDGDDARYIACEATTERGELLVREADEDDEEWEG